MTEKFSLGLKESYQRPIVSLKSWHNIDALIDTGASFPVWTADEEILRDMGAELLTEGIGFGGFGGQTIGNLYKLHDFRIGKLIFPEFAVVSSNNLGNVPFHIILSATVFRELIFEIDNKKHILTVTVPDDESLVRKLKIQDSNGRLHILYHKDNVDNFY